VPCLSVLGKLSMLHNILVTNSNGHMLLAKYFDGSSVDARKEWERQLFRETCMNWNETGYQVAAVGYCACSLSVTVRSMI
jgi:hypothetical protein